MEDYIVSLKRVPIQLLFLEKLDATLEDFLLSDEFTSETLQSCLFQISFALAYLQKHYEFTHNDLHINNVMYQETTTAFLYYKLNNMYFKIPTYGKIFKIIDYGRSIFTFKHKVYRNDVFSRNSEAGGQYSYPHQVAFLKQEATARYDTIGEPNYHFDLCRLATTILDELPPGCDESLQALLNHMCTDRHGNNFCEMKDDFDLYINIAKNADKSLPLSILCHKIFTSYRIKKHRFPKKLYYTL